MNSLGSSPRIHFHPARYDEKHCMWLMYAERRDAAGSTLAREDVFVKFGADRPSVFQEVSARERARALLFVGVGKPSWLSRMAVESLSAREKRLLKRTLTIASAILMLTMAWLVGLQHDKRKSDALVTASAAARRPSGRS